jgi:hypothetical protein
MLQHHTISNTQMLYIFTNLDNLPHDLVAEVGVAMMGNSRGCDTPIAICIDKVQVTTADTGQGITHSYPAGCRQRLAWHFLHAQRCERREVSTAPKPPK